MMQRLWGRCCFIGLEVSLGAAREVHLEDENGAKTEDHVD
jgi:hypothetical protein